MSVKCNGRLEVEGFFDQLSSTISYIAYDRLTRHCAIIDSVLDFDFAAVRTSTGGADRIARRVRELGLRVDWILETHVHADHISAAPYLRSLLGGRIAISEGITGVQAHFGEFFNVGRSFQPDGRQFDRLLADGEGLEVGGLNVKILATPGHTPACLTYLFDDASTPAAFVGDTLFMPDVGTARCDFQGGDARALFRSIRRILSLPVDTVLYMCHDYPSGGRAPAFITTVAEQRGANLHARDGISEDEFVALRTQRDATLPMPALMFPSVQLNMRAGNFPEAEENGVSYLKIPMNAV